MPRLLIVHHTTSPALHSMYSQVLAGAMNGEIKGVEVLSRPALVAGPAEVLEADACLLGTPANIGYMSGALKHFFDQIYYPCLEATPNRPYALYVHGNSDTAGAVHAVEAIAKGLKWRRVQQPLEVVGQPSRSDLDACWELGAAVSAGLVG